MVGSVVAWTASSWILPADGAGADIIAIDRPGIGRSDVCTMSSIAQWAETVERVADQLHVGEFAVAGWSGGGPYALACAAAMPNRVRAVATLAGMAPLQTFRHIGELGLLADVLLIPAARTSPQAAAALLWLTRFLVRWLPDAISPGKSAERRAAGIV